MSSSKSYACCFRKWNEKASSPDRLMCRSCCAARLSNFIESQLILGEKDTDFTTDGLGSSIIELPLFVMALVTYGCKDQPNLRGNKLIPRCCNLLIPA